MTTRIYANDPDGSRLPIKVDATSKASPPATPVASEHCG